MSDLLDKKWAKVFCVYINPIIIGIDLPLIISWWSEKTFKFYATVVIGVVLLGLYAYTSYIYEDKEKKEESEKKKLETENQRLEQENHRLIHEVDSFDKGMRELATLFHDSSNSLNKISARVLEGDRTLDIWNFKKVCTGICNSVYGLLCEMCSPCDNFTVNIMLSDVTAKGGKRNITMIAHKGKYEKYPGKFEEKLYFEKHSTFYAVKVCKSDNTEIRILTTKDEVNEKFVYVDEEHPEYNQYVGIPIVCSGKKIICLLQICAFGDDKIGETKSDILELVTKYLFPFTQYALLTYKVEKGLVSSLSIIEKKEKEERQNEDKTDKK